MQRRSFLAGGTAAVMLGSLIGQIPRAVAAELEITDEHPRLLTRDLSPVAALVAGDADAQQWYARTKQAADALLTTDPVTYQIPDGLRLLATSREVIHRVYTLAMTYLVEQDVQYRDRLWDELETVCAFSDWNDHRHFLDTAEMTHAVAIGYDWFHDEWTEDQRATLVAGLATHGLAPGLEIFEGRSTPHPWFTWTNNWNIVCNGGLIAGALAIIDVEPELAGQVLDHALDTLPLAVDEYGPDGGYPEGVGYWDYAIKYLVLLLSSLEAATGETTELAGSPGVDSTVDFPMHLSGPSGLGFNYYDSDSSSPRPAEAFWLAARFDRPDHSWWAKLGADTNQPGWKQLPLGLLWYDPEHTSAPIESGTARDAHFTGGCEIATMRSGWERDDTLYLAGKAGVNDTSHSDLDIGTFVLDALGQRWAAELGSDDYGLPGYFHETRWTYYRKRTEGQNTLVVNPSADPGQGLTATGALQGWWSTATSAAFTIDGTGVDEAFSFWQRGWRIDDFRRHVVVQDEVRLNEPGELWWFMHTAAAIAISEDGRGAVLTLAGRELRADLVGPVDATFWEMAAAPLWTSPQPEGQATNAGLRKLAIRLSGVETATITVQFTPVLTGHELEVAAQSPLSAWTEPRDTTAVLESLEIDGDPVAGFSPDNFTYGAVLSPDSTITAAAADGGRTRIVRTEGGGARIVVSRAKHRSGIYLLWPDLPVGPGNFPEGVIASSDDGNIPANTLDGDLETRWSAEGDGEWIGYDLGGDGPVSEVRIAWFSGDERQTSFDIEVAAEAETTWTTVFSGLSSGTTADLETYAFDTVEARYVRIVGHGNTKSGWNSVAEVEITGREVDWEPVLRIEELDWEVPTVLPGQTVPTVLKARRNDGSVVDLPEAEISFHSDDPEIVTIDADGVVTAVAEGESAVVAIVAFDRRLLHRKVPLTVADPSRPVYESVADTFVRSGDYADDVYGRQQRIYVKHVPDPEGGFYRRAFVEFDLPAQDRPVSVVSFEFLGCVADGNGTEFDLSVCLAEGTIDEATTSWNNQPDVGATLGTSHITDEEKWWSVDLTGIEDRIAAGGTLVLALDQLPDSGQGLNTRMESCQSANPTRLRLELG